MQVMEGLDNSFGFTVATGPSGAERAWTNLAYALAVPDAELHDPAAVAARVGTAGSQGAQAFGAALEQISPGDSLAPRLAEVIGRLGAPGLAPVLQNLEVGDRKRAAQSAARALNVQSLVVLTQAVGMSFRLPLSQPLLERGAERLRTL
jgi:hypothetical protein